MIFNNHVLTIGEVSAIELASRFGTPLYIYDRALIDRQIDRLLAAFGSLQLQPFYAMKANSNLRILELIRSRGFGCDAVSPGEVFLAKRAGFRGDEIWFTCSNVSDEDLMSLRDDSLVVNLNSMSEVDRCLRLRIPNRIALRINPDIGAGHHRDVVTGGFGVKFGIDLAEVDEARKVLEDQGHSIIGLHAHIGSGITEISPLLASAARLAGLTDRFSALEWVNFGGGISVPYRPREVEFPLDEYGRSLGDLVGPRLRERNLRAILEPGRFLVAQSGVLLTTVTTKRISNGFEWLGIDTGFNHLVRPSRYGAYHHILNASRSDDSWLRENFGQTTSNDSGVIIAGNLCESGDVFTREGEELRLRPMPPTRVGDLLAICDAGAYGFSMASHYNARLLPAEVLVDGSEATVIRERQTFEDLLH